VLATLLPYLSGEKRTFICPVANETTRTGDFAPTDISDTNYLVNGALVGRQTAPIGGRSSRAIFLQESRHRWNTAWMRPERENAQVPPNPPPKPGIYTRWCWNNTVDGVISASWGQDYSSVHNEGGNLLYLDGHADYRKHSDLHASDFGLTGGTGVGGNAEDVSTSPHNQTYLCVFD
jgi:prepilin-type processing-associated H-X9-DG protein